MADEKPGAGSNGTAPETSGDTGQWFEAAGFDAKALPDATEIKAARDFYSKYGGESELYTKSQLDEYSKKAIGEWLPANYQKLSDYFRNLYAGEKPSQAAKAAENDDPTSAQIEALKRELLSRLQGHESVLTELLEAKQGLTKQGELNAWQRGFTERVRGTVKQAGGRWSPETIEREVMRRYAAGEFQDDSPAGIVKVVKGILKEKDQERQALVREFAQAGMIRPEAGKLKPNLKLEDVFKDPAQMDALTEAIINHGLPDGQP